jgi:hypothetical protein
MEVDHPIDSESKFKRKISCCKISYTKHFEEERLPYRKNITKDLIESHLKNPEDLTEFTYAKDEHSREKYEALFDKSTKYFLKIVLSIS